MRRSIPAFLVGLVGTFVGWVLGSGFGLAAGFGGLYEAISRLTPFTHATELLFSQYYGASIGRPVASVQISHGSPRVGSQISSHWGSSTSQVE